MIIPANMAVIESTSANTVVIAVCIVNPMDADLGRGYIKNPLVTALQDLVHPGGKCASPFGD